jgi:hypothetical protein
MLSRLLRDRPRAIAPAAGQFIATNPGPHLGAFPFVEHMVGNYKINLIHRAP